ncbi:hypothetical protein KEM54_003092, partial [Ascosphaera aggregata]
MGANWHVQKNWPAAMKASLPFMGTPVTRFRSGHSKLGVAEDKLSASKSASIQANPDLVSLKKVQLAVNYDTKAVLTLSLSVNLWDCQHMEAALMAIFVERHVLAEASHHWEYDGSNRRPINIDDIAIVIGTLASHATPGFTPSS